MNANRQTSEIQELEDLDNLSDFNGGVNADDNTRLAMLLDEKRRVLTEILTVLPITCLYILTKNGQLDEESSSEPKQDENGPLALLQSDFLDCYDAARRQGLDSAAFKQQLQLLHQAQQDISLMGEDINGLYALVLSLCSENSQSVNAKIPVVAKLSSNPRINALVSFYQRELPGFLCPQIMVSNSFLNELIEHYRQWSNVRQQFVNHNHGLLHLLKQQYKGEVLSEEDLLQEGLIGLLKAIDRFDYQLGFKFSTYATYWIRQSMSRALIRCERTVRLPFAQMTAINKLCKAREKIVATTGSAPSDRELANELKWKLADVCHLQNISQLSVSLDEGFGGENNDNHMLKYLRQECHDSPLKQHGDRQLHELFGQAIAQLNSKEKLIICWRFGFNGANELTLEEIGKQLDLTRERVRQIQKLALEKIKIDYGAQLQHFVA